MRAVAIPLLMLTFIAGCTSDPTPPQGGSGSKVVAVTKDSSTAAKSEPAPTVSDEKAVAVIDAAIKAHGGAEALAKAAVMERSVKGTRVLPGVKDLPFSAEVAVELPDHYRNVVTAELAEQTNVQTVVINGDKGWQASGGATLALSSADVDGFRDELYVLGAVTLVPLKNKEVIVALRPDEEVRDKPAAVVAAYSKGHPDLKLYFDKESKLLVKVSFRTKLQGISAPIDLVILEHGEYDGAKLPSHQQEFISGTKQADYTTVSLRMPAQINASKFERP
jgi:hypothetical protein